MASFRANSFIGVLCVNTKMHISLVVPAVKDEKGEVSVRKVS